MHVDRVLYQLFSILGEEFIQDRQGSLVWLAIQQVRGAAFPKKCIHS